MLGDCRDRLRELEDCSVHSVVTDPPYELGFMGKSWDSTGVAYDVRVWEECLRVLKPGGHLLAFGGSRTYHRLAVAIEDAGFQIRDQIMWVYGSGFPKSLNISKAIDKAAGANCQGRQGVQGGRSSMEQVICVTLKQR
jgi:DNA modification methylase